MKKLKIICILLTSCLTTGNTLNSAEHYNHHADYIINWESGTITAKGKMAFQTDKTGKPVDYYSGGTVSINRARSNSYSLVKERAIENLMIALRHIQADPKKEFNEILQTDSMAQKRMYNILTSDVKYYAYPGDFFTINYNAVLNIGALMTALSIEFPMLEFPLIDNTPLPTEYTSLIVDGRGLDLKPMLLPVVYNEDGLEIYSRIYIDSRYASRYGMASYYYSEDRAKKSKKAGEHPYYTVGLKSLNHCPVISNRDVRRILGSDITRNNLKKCRVIIIIDKEK